MNLFHSGRQLFLTSAIDNMNLRSQTQRCSGRVHCHVAAAYYRHLPAVHNGCAGILVKSFHQIASGQILIGGKYTVGILSRNSHELRQTGSRTDKHGFKPFLLNQLVNRYRFPHHYIGLYLHPKSFHIFDFFCHHVLLRKTEFRNSINQHASRLMQRFKNSHFISHLSQISGTG